MKNPRRLDLFCRVIDNYGDIGICWRLARQLWREHGVRVTLWVDDLHSFARICPAVLVDVAQQSIDGVCVRHWADQNGRFTAADVADIVIEFFAVDLPPAYIEAMVGCTPRPLWFNLEGLTAEEWVEGCHKLPSPHPRLPLTKHFFFPGFTAQTGGLLCEAGLDAERRQFQAEPEAMAAFLAELGLTPAQCAAFKVSLFCYPHAPVSELFEVWREGGRAVTCLVPEGVAVDAVQAFLGEAAVAGACATQGALTLRVLPFVPQADYDRLLWACDLNFVRGEDSFVRAQWAGRPFVWHIYPQDDNLHHKKLRAFLVRYADFLLPLEHFALHWNGAPVFGQQTKQTVSQRADHEADWSALWSDLVQAMPAMSEQAHRWQVQMHSHGDLAANLLTFAGTLR